MLGIYIPRVLPLRSKTAFQPSLVLDSERTQIFGEEIEHFNNNLMTSQRSKSLVNFEFLN